MRRCQIVWLVVCVIGCAVPAAYADELDKVMQNGYAADDEEYISGVRAIAVPLNHYGAYTPAIWVVGFKASMNSKKIPTIIEQTKAAADRINQKLSPVS